MAKKKERGNGEGTLYKRKDGKWVSQVTVGFEPKTGKPIRKTFTGNTRAEAAKQMNEVVASLNKGIYIEQSKVTLETWLKGWLKGRKPHIEESSWNNYEMFSRLHIIPEIGHITLNALKTRHIQELLNSKIESGRVDGKGGLSPRTVKYVYQTLHASLEQAVKERQLVYNPAEHVELPKQVKMEMRPFTEDELSRFFTAAKGNRFFTLFVLAVASGMRRGELLALTWDNICFQEGLIDVKKQLVRSKEHGLIIKGLKTKKSRRTIEVSKDVMEMLKDHKKKQNEKKLLLGPHYHQEHDLVFATDDGKPIDPKNMVTRHFDKVIERHNKNVDKKAKEKGSSPDEITIQKIPKIRFHDLRHTYATLSIEQGIDLATVSKNLGHSSYAITADTYSHMTAKIKSDAAEKICAVVTSCIEKK